jgi:hypothetical protein
MLRIHRLFLRKVAKDAGFDFEKKAFGNPLDNSMWENMISGALKALEVVAIASLDYKLTAIVKLLQSWLKDKKEEKARTKKQLEYGVNYKDPSGFTDQNPYGGGYYY